MRPAGCGSRRSIASAVMDFPQPDSPSSAKVSPGYRFEADAIDGAAPALPAHRSADRLRHGVGIEIA